MIRFLRSTAAVPVAIFVVGCTSTGGSDVTWRLPCAAQGSYENQPGEVWDYQLAYDGDGNLRFERESYNDVVNYTYIAEWDGDEVVREEQDGPYGFLYDVQFENGHRVFAMFDDRATDSNADYTIRWTWDGDQVVGWDADYTDAASTDLSASITYAGDGFIQEMCYGTTCDTTTAVGEFDHWTLRRTDFGSDGTIDTEIRVTYDAQDLILTYERDALSGGVLAPDVYSSWERQPDGTLIRYHWESFVADPRRWLVVYQFCD